MIPSMEAVILGASPRQAHAARPLFRRVIQRGACAMRMIAAPVLMSALAAALPPDCSTAQARDLLTSVSSALPKRAPTRDRKVERIKQRVTTGSVNLVRVDVGLLRRCRGLSSGKLTFRNNWIDCGRHRLRLGLISGSGDGTFAVRRDRVTGTISRGDATFRVEPVRGGVHALTKVDTARFPTEEAEPNRDHTQFDDTGAKTGPSPIEIDVLVAYTRSAGRATADISGLIHKAIIEANQSYRNSDINIQLNLVDSFQLQYTEGSKPFKKIVDDFANNSVVEARRDRSGADVSVLIVNGSGFCRPSTTPAADPEPGDLNCCGLADALMATEATAFAVVNYQCGLGPNYSFAHEIGHLQGATHNIDGELPAYRPYGHGFQNNSGRARWRTIMANDCDPYCVRLPYWSNPRISRDGVPMGTPETNDNARVLNETAATIAGFRNRARAR